MFMPVRKQQPRHVQRPLIQKWRTSKSDSYLWWRTSNGSLTRSSIFKRPLHSRGHRPSAVRCTKTYSSPTHVISNIVYGLSTQEYLSHRGLITHILKVCVRRKPSINDMKQRQFVEDKCTQKDNHMISLARS